MPILLHSMLFLHQLTAGAPYLEILTRSGGVTQLLWLSWGGVGVMGWVVGGGGGGGGNFIPQIILFLMEHFYSFSFS